MIVESYNSRWEQKAIESNAEKILRFAKVQIALLHVSMSREHVGFKLSATEALAGFLGYFILAKICRINFSSTVNQKI